MIKVMKAKKERNVCMEWNFSCESFPFYFANSLINEMEGNFFTQNWGFVYKETGSNIFIFSYRK